jgi:hypothetical protein
VFTENRDKRNPKEAELINGHRRGGKVSPRQVGDITGRGQPT